MLDFTSALYLGLRHPSESLRPWGRLTTGRPAALQDPPGASRVASELAELMECERATLLTSTLHGFWDLFTMLAGDDHEILLDAGAYPIARWGAERAAARGIRVRRFTHFSPSSLAAVLRTRARPWPRRPIIVADGFCPRCGRAAPVPRYLDAARRLGGLVVLDDTQALGILGRRAGARNPYGSGGGGTLPWHGSRDPAIIVVSSLAKGFGAPLAVLAGNGAVVERFEAESGTRMHCSPPSQAAIGAAAHAPEENRRSGDRRRAILLHRVCTFRRYLRAAGLGLNPGLFPVQSLRIPAGIRCEAVYEDLLSAGVRPVLTARASGAPDRLSFLITATHSEEEVVYAASAVARSVRRALEDASDRMAVGEDVNSLAWERRDQHSVAVPAVFKARGVLCRAKLNSDRK